MISSKLDSKLPLIGIVKSGPMRYYWTTAATRAGEVMEWSPIRCMGYAHGAAVVGWSGLRISERRTVYTCVTASDEAPTMPDEAAPVRDAILGQPPRRLPRDEWPWIIHWAASLAQPGDKGIGDVVARLTGAAGVWFKATYKAVFGVSCGCGRRCRGVEREISAGRCLSLTKGRANSADSIGTKGQLILSDRPHQ
jgi:hypothetical protein